MQPAPRHSVLMCISVKHVSGFCHNKEFRAATIERHSRAVATMRKFLQQLSLWRGVADIRAAMGAPQKFVDGTTLQTSNTCGDCVSKLQRRYFPAWFRPRPIQTKRVLANWNMVRHVLRVVAVKLQHACALVSLVPW